MDGKTQLTRQIVGFHRQTSKELKNNVKVLLYVIIAKKYMQKLCDVKDISLSLP